MTLAFLIGFGVSVPFMATDLRTGSLGPAQIRLAGASAGGPHGR